MLVEWCTMNRFVIMNMWFQNHIKNLYTWKTPEDTCRNQIDYIMMKNFFQHSISGVGTYPSADCDNGHILLMDNYM